MPTDDLWRSRLRLDAFAAPDPAPVRSGVPSFLGKVTSTGTNLGVGKFCQVVPVALTGTESDGSASVATAGPASVIALAIGPAAPATNDLVIVRRVDHRWVFDKQTIGAGGTATVGFELCCPSNAIPATLTITFTFRPGTNAATYGNSLQNTTLTYFTTRPSYDGGTGTFSPKYVSPMYLDDFGEECFLVIQCNASGQFLLQRAQAFSPGVHASSPGSSCGFFNSVTCSPFLLTGLALSGSACAALGFGSGTDNATVS